MRAALAGKRASGPLGRLPDLPCAPEESEPPDEQHNGRRYRNRPGAGGNGRRDGRSAGTISGAVSWKEPLRIVDSTGGPAACSTAATGAASRRSTTGATAACER